MRNPLVVLRRGRGCCLILVTILLILALVACLAAGWSAGQAFAQSHTQGLDVMLILDQSNSLWELGGVGSDPEMLRMAGARLIATYLGVDDLTMDYRLGLVYFGTRPKLVAPLTSLGNPAGRESLLVTLDQPPEPMGWTDVNTSLELAYEELIHSERAEPNRAKVVILFTDGRPQTESLHTLLTFEAYLTDLEAQVRRFAEQDAAVFAVLLGSPATDADPQTRDLYRPLWVDLAESGIGVYFYDARSNKDLADVYHDIVVRIHRNRSQGAILDETVDGSISVPIQVPSSWSRTNFVVHKSDAALEISIYRPDGSHLKAGDAGVRYSADPKGARDEVWTVAAPTPGEWRVVARGQGMVTVWLDYVPAPSTPTPTPTMTQLATESPSSAPTAMAAPSDTPTATPTSTPLAVIHTGLEVHEPQVDGRYRVGKPVPIVVSCSGGEVQAFWVGPGQPDGIPVSLVAREVGRLEGQIPAPEAAGTYTLTVRYISEVGRGVILQDEATVVFAVEPRRSRSSWAWLGGVLMLAAGSFGLWRQRRNQPRVEGTLKLVQGPTEERRGQSWDLGQLGRERITLGGATSCDIVLAHDPEVGPRAAAILARRDADGNSAPVLANLSGNGVVRVNGQAVPRDHRLRDQDTVQIGGYRLQYENLALRRQDLAWQPGELRIANSKSRR